MRGPTKRTDSFSYDSHDRLSSVVHPDSTHLDYTYDSRGNLKTVKDENHAAANTTYAYDGLNRLISVTQTLTGAPGNQTATGYAYDVQDNLTSVTDPNGNTTTYTYDDFRRLQTQTSPVSGVTSYSYDPAGNLLSSTDANGATTTRIYDAANRVASAASTRTGFSTETVSWTYDDSTAGSYGKGRLATMTDPSGSAAYAYERRGLLASEARTIQGYSYSLGYGYDGNGNRSSITYPSGRVVSYLFDFADRPNFVSGALSGYPIALYLTSASYKPFGPIAQLQLKATQTITYDSRYRPLEDQVIYFYMGGYTTLADYTYTEDAVGNITQIHDALTAGYDRNFAYDDLNRLTTANSGSSLWGTATGNGYTYDRMGNMLAATLGSSYTASFSYVGTTPKLSSVTDNGTPVPVTYDTAGNTTAESSATYAYTPRNLLSAGDGYSYVYDGRGLRTVLNGSGPPAGKKYYFYSPEMSLLAETEFNTSGGRPAILYEYIWLNGRPIAQVDWPNTTHWTHADHLGTPFLQTDSSGNAYWQVEYEPYGRVFSLRTVSDQHQPLRFPGQEVEQITTGTNGITPRTYNIFRWYRRRWGRYTQSDPAWKPTRVEQINPYSYAASRPLRFSDRLGLVAWQCNYSVGTINDPVGPGAAVFNADCTSECACGKRLSVRLFGTLVGGSVGPLPFGYSSSSITLTDRFACPDSGSLNGVISYGSLGLVTPFIGFSCSHLYVGSAFGKSCSPSKGLDAGLDGYAGVGGVVSSSQSCCGSK